MQVFFILISKQQLDLQKSSNCKVYSHWGSYWKFYGKQLQTRPMCSKVFSILSKISVSDQHTLISSDFKSTSWNYKIIIKT